MKASTSLFLAAAILSTAGTSALAAQPNILLVIADDYGTDGNSLYHTNSSRSLPPTPNINSLYDSGVLFRNAYAYPTCSPSRACLLTGRFGFRTGIGLTLETTDNEALVANEPTIPKLLSAHPQLGYRHAQIGKWHLGFRPTDPQTLGGWDHFSGALPCCLPSFYRWPKTVNGVTSTSTNYATTENVDDAISWIKEQGTNPWFLWLAFNAPHQTFHKPPNALHSYDDLSSSATAISQNPRPYYEAATEAMDTELGRLLSQIDRSKTVIIFIGDNGTPEQVVQPPYSSTRAKFSLYEGGIRVPMMIAGPLIKQPRRDNTNLVHVVDLFATILEIAGVNLESALRADVPSDSRSLLPFLTSTPASPRDWILAEQFGSSLANEEIGRAVRNDTAKLIRWRTGTEGFYDLTSDPFEQTNLLSRALSAEESLRYTSLTNILRQLQNVPQVTGVTVSSNRFSVNVDYLQGVAFSLYHSAALDGPWQRITPLSRRTNFTVTLTDRNPIAGTNFYRVAAPIR